MPIAMAIDHLETVSCRKPATWFRKILHFPRREMPDSASLGSKKVI